MILQRLAEHYDRIPGITPPGFSVQKVSFCIVLHPDGKLNMFQSMLRQEGRFARPQQIYLPGQTKSSGSGLNPCFLWDRLPYLLGFSFDPSPEKQQRASEAFESFRTKHLRLRATFNDPRFDAVCRFLSEWDPANAGQHEDLSREITRDCGVFRIEGEMQYLHSLFDLPEEEDRHPRRQKSLGGQLSQCLITGRETKIARLHKPEIKGVKGARSQGVPMVSMNEAAYMSYGKDQSYNAPVGESTVFRYANALNHLLKERRFFLGDMTVVYWADHAENGALMEAALSELFGGPIGQEASAGPEEDLERVRQAHVLLTQLRDGTLMTSLKLEGNSTRFFILGLSPNASRLSVRLWVEADAAEMQRRLGWHLKDVALKDRNEDTQLTLRRMVAASGRWDARKRRYETDAVSPHLAGDLARSVLTCAAYPQSLLATMVRRIHSDTEIDFARVSTIKACLVRNSRLRGFPLEVPMELDVNHSDTAYRCGRLFAILEKSQHRAQFESGGGELNSTIKDRYFSSASTTPALVFPRLFRLNQHHLAKLKTGSKMYLERLIAEVMSEPFDFPQLLSLPEQGRFIIGYFQQYQNLQTKRDDKNTGENQ